MVVQMKGITKVYPNGIAANQNVDFSVRKGEIHALMGENGAGKSTLMKMLFGLEQPEEGEIIVDGETVALSSPTVAISKGVGMVHQHFMLVPSLTVAENIVLGMEPKKRGMFLKALVRGATILILDEPTAVLTTQETTELFKELIHFKETGHTIIFISHKLKEVKQITDRLTIMRGGKSVGVYNTADVSEQDISRLMVGRDVVLKVEDLSFTNDWSRKMLDGVSFTVRKGEILGVAGVEGNGQRELVELLFDMAKPDGGTIQVEGQPITGAGQSKIRGLGVSHIPEDRMLFGVAGTATIEENLISDRYWKPKFNKGPLFDMKAIHQDTQQLIGDYQILCKSGGQSVANLSGGNIQKVVVAREFSSDPKLIIADQPTRGIDVGATEFIRRKLVELSRSGVAVLLVSADLNEVMELSDSLMVMYGGRIAAYFEDTSNLTDEEMGEYMLGLKHQAPEEVGRVCHE